MTVFLGGPPALMLAAIAPLPENVPELMLASLIAGRKLPLVPRARGRIRWWPTPSSRSSAACRRACAAPEGPVRRPLRLLLAAPRLPRVRGRRARAPPRRDLSRPPSWASRARRTSSSATSCRSCCRRCSRWSCPAVARPLVVRRDRLPLAGGGGREASATRARRMASAFRILGEGQLSLTKFLLVTDRPVDLRDFRATLEHVLARTRPETDLYVFSNLSMDTLDYTGPAVNEGSKGVWLGLGDPVRELPREFRPPVAPAAGGHRRARLLRRLPGGRRAALRRRSGRGRSASPRHPAFAGWPLRRAHRRAARARPRSAINFLWTTFTRFEPAADIHAAANGRRAQPPRVRAADRDRRAPQARLPGGAVLRRGDGARGHPPLAGVLPRGASRWATPRPAHLDPAVIQSPRQS